MLFGPKKIHAIGLDISDSSIRVMQLDPKRGGYNPSAFAKLDLPNTLIINHMIPDEQKLAEYITKAIRQAKNVSTRHVVASIPEAKSFVRVIKMQKMSETEIENAIPWELEQDIPIPIDLVYMDWRVVKEEGDSLYILVVATPKDYVNALMGALKIAKLKPVALELESQATARALITPQEANQATLIVDMSASLTSFMIHSGGSTLEYTSNIPIGGNQVTESISKALGLTPKEAEKMKREKGLLVDSKKANVRQAMLPILDNIIDEIRNVINFHDAHSVLSPGVNKVVLSGGAASLNGLLDYVTARLNLGTGKPVERIVLGNPWANVASSEEEIANIGIIPEDSLSYVTAIGLALRGVDV